MNLSADPSVDGWPGLPEHLPVGTMYVVEGGNAAEGDFGTFLHYVVLPDGRRIHAPARFGRQRRSYARPRGLERRPLHAQRMRQDKLQNGRPGRAAVRKKIARRKKIVSRHGTT